MRTTRTATRRLGLVATLLAAVLAPGCHDDSNTITGVGAPARTPGPAVHGDLGGDWFGTFTTDDEADCHSGETHVVLAQSGDHLTGTIEGVVNSCGFGGALDVTVRAGAVSGTLRQGSFGPANVVGHADETSMHLTVSDLIGPQASDGSGPLIPGGTLDLHR